MVPYQQQQYTRSTDGHHTNSTPPAHSRCCKHLLSLLFVRTYQSQSQAGGPGSAEFRLMSSTLEKALGTVRAKKQSRKLGRYEVDLLHRIQVSTGYYCVRWCAYCVAAEERPDLVKSGCWGLQQRYACSSLGCLSA
jgi:hypothetical protein